MRVADERMLEASWRRGESRSRHTWNPSLELFSIITSCWRLIVCFVSRIRVEAQSHIKRDILMCAFTAVESFRCREASSTTWKLKLRQNIAFREKVLVAWYLWKTWEISVYHQPHFSRNDRAQSHSRVTVQLQMDIGSRISEQVLVLHRESDQLCCCLDLKSRAHFFKKIYLVTRLNLKSSIYSSHRTVEIWTVAVIDLIP